MTTESELAALYGCNAFPIEVTRRGAAVSFDFAQTVGAGSPTLKWGFGVDKGQTVLALRLLADMVADGVAIPQEAEHTTKATGGEEADWVLQTISLTVAVRQRFEIERVAA
jgi:hypothetical protein